MSYVPTIEAPQGVDKDAWNAAISALRQACGWHVAPAAVTTARIRIEGNTILLPSLAVSRVIEVKVRGVVIDPSRYELMPELVIVLNRHIEGHHGRALVAEVTFEHGYDTFPEELVSLAASAASRGVAGSTVTQVGQVKFGGSGVLPGAAEAMRASPLLDRYRLVARP